VRHLSIEDSSPVMKIYAFWGVVQENDSIAFALLNEAMKDSTRVSYFCSCVLSSSPYKSFLLEYYYSYISRKYRIGLTSCSRGKCFNFPEPSKKIWRQKEKEFKMLLEENQILLSDVRGY
jgi:hypothetical protein